jgi:hypothetical protein
MAEWTGQTRTKRSEDSRQVPRFSYNSLVAKLRVLLDENLSRDLEKAFAKKIPVYTVADLGLNGAGDPRIIEEAVYRKCLVVTADRKFMDVYRNHEWRKGHDGRYFYGLIFLTEDKTTGQLRQLKLATPRITPEHDDLIAVSSAGTITVENLGGRED